MQRVPTQEEIKEKRKKANEDLISRVKKGEVAMGNNLSTWFPSRPAPKKDRKEVEKLYGPGTKVLGVKVVGQDMNKDETKETEGESTNGHN